ncbi:lytic transglycosylase domain-containing protein [Acidimangrovimonas sediminis]|uniref:lytic transglycosylase domain-containing protein n=1 Tax=Acidimangrovimonas sediminis TaxID=2056283 RepID=UPI000C7F7F21|nr:lytic transglycosylase domain-containing protein [Acidimangrovimonas sediminis]
MRRVRPTALVAAASALLPGAVCGAACAALFGALLGAIFVVPAGAEGWAGFYTPTARPAAAAPVAPSGPLPAPTLPGGALSAPTLHSATAPGSEVCLRAILDAQARYAIPGNLLLAVGLQEAGLKRSGRLTVWPWTVNAAGDGRMFESAGKAKAWVRERQAAGVSSIDIGCMQVNLRWHPDAFQSLDQAFDPATNVDYAARFLKDLYDRTGNWLKAAGSYHSFNEAARNRYLAGLTRNLEVANARAPEFARRLGPAQLMTASAPAAPGATVHHAPRPASDPEPQIPQPGIGWWAALSDRSDAPRVSIYSARELQPVLPAFRQEF